MRDVLIYDIETDGLDINKAKVKWFGAYSYLFDKYYLIPFDKDEVQKILDRHRVFIGFNNKGFDNPILENNGCGIGDFKIVIDLYEMSAPKGTSEYNKNFKNKLKQMGLDISKFSLKEIIKILKLDDMNKGEIDYKIFQKNTWTNNEIKDIIKYLRQDIILTKKLFEWYEEQFEPLKELLKVKDQRNYKHLSSSLASLAYMIMCNKADLQLEWGEKEEGCEHKTFSGGHHIEPKKDKVRGNIVNIDFTSAYPHALIMGNLYSPSNIGWNGNGYFKVYDKDIQGIYNDKEFGKIEKALREMFMLRLKAKKAGDKVKSQAYKICINSQYGLTGNPIFKTFYNPTTASDCTHIVRVWLRRIAKILEEEGFEILYGFTDNIIVKIPEKLTEDRLLYEVDKFIQDVKNNMPFPQDTFGMELETRMKFIWFVAKNCYLYVDDKNEVKYKSTLLNKNTPKSIMKLFENYIKPKIIKELDINFTEKELINEVLNILKKDLSLAGEEYKVGELNSYKVKTSLQYQISKAYGEGIHHLIPNNKMIGIGKAKGTIKNKPIRYCSFEEFNKNKLKVEDIELKRLMQHIKPFFTKKDKTIQESLSKCQC